LANILFSMIHPLRFRVRVTKISGKLCEAYQNYHFFSPILKRNFDLSLIIYKKLTLLPYKNNIDLTVQNFLFIDLSN